MADEKWKHIDSEILFNGKFKNVRLDTFKLPDNSICKFEIVESSIVVSCLALTEDNKVIVLKNFRPGPQMIVYEPPGGALDEGETIEQAIGRELLEETGYTGELEYVGRYPSNAYDNEIRYCFVARNCKKVGDQKLDVEEKFIELQLITLNNLKYIISNGLTTEVGTFYMCLNHIGAL